jgi:hypothetical protein
MKEYFLEDIVVITERYTKGKFSEKGKVIAEQMVNPNRISPNRVSKSVRIQFTDKKKWYVYVTNITLMARKIF